MRALWKKAVILAAIGFATGVLVGLGFLAIAGINTYYAQNGLGRFMLYIALSGVLGAVNMGSATIYSLERWGLLRCTLTHFCIAIASWCSVGFALGWLSLREPATLWTVVVCVIVYFIIWLIMCLRYRRQIRQINAALQRWKSDQGEE